MDGHLVAYWEQGWEGRIEYLFQPDDADKPVSIVPGDQLTIFAGDGAALWAGEIAWVRPPFWERYRNPFTIWNWVKQKGVNYGEWLGFFWRQPPLRARLLKSQAASK